MFGLVICCGSVFCFWGGVFGFGWWFCGFDGLMCFDGWLLLGGVGGLFVWVGCLVLFVV